MERDTNTELDRMTQRILGAINRELPPGTQTTCGMALIVWNDEEFTMACNASTEELCRQLIITLTHIGSDKPVARVKLAPAKEEGHEH